MKKLNLPEYEPRFNAERTEVFDPIRKKFVALIPEEWVRQHFINYLVANLGFPAGLIRVELGIEYNHLRKRPDILAFDREGLPLLIVECKSFDQKMNKGVFDQVSVYNNVIGAPLAIATNGLTHFCWKYEDGIPQFLNEIPSFEKALKIK